jgi:hypothetical protein
MKKKIILGSIGAVVIVLLMISSATAVAMPLSNESSNSGASVTNYVEPGIHISVMQKGILRASLKHVDDPDVRVLLQGIIKKKGPVDSNDIEQIIIDNNLEIGTITFGGIATGGPGSYPDTSGGYAMCPRRPFCFGVILPIIFLHFQAFYQDSIDTSPNYPVQITIGGKFIDYSISGLAIGFIGFVFNNPAPRMGFECNGAALLIHYRATGNQQNSQTRQTQLSSQPSEQ